MIIVLQRGCPIIQAFILLVTPEMAPNIEPDAKEAVKKYCNHKHMNMLFFLAFSFFCPLFSLSTKVRLV